MILALASLHGGFSFGALRRTIIIAAAV